MSWLRAIRHHGARLRTQVTKVAEQTLDKARAAGAMTARQIIALQQAARLNPRLMHRSAESVRDKTPARQADRSWQAGYVAQAARELPQATRGDMVTADGSLMIVRDSDYFGTREMHASRQANPEAGA